MTGTGKNERRRNSLVYNIRVIPILQTVSQRIIQTFFTLALVQSQGCRWKMLEARYCRKRSTSLGSTVAQWNSDFLSRSDLKQSVPHVLNAKNHYGGTNRASALVNVVLVTAANMAGRGTDIKSLVKVLVSGGLCVIGTERRRVVVSTASFVDVQVVKVTQVNPEFYLSLEDDLIKPERLKRVSLDVLIYVWQKPSNLVCWHIRSKQRKTCWNNYITRKQVLNMMTLCVNNVRSTL